MSMPSSGAAGTVGSRQLPLPTAVVTVAPGAVAGTSDPRRLRIRPESGSPTGPDAPAFLQGGLALVIGAGARVYYQRIGPRLIVTGAV